MPDKQRIYFPSKVRVKNWKEFFVCIAPKGGFDPSPQERWKFSQHIKRWEHRYGGVHPVKSQPTGEIGRFEGVSFITIEGDKEDG